MYTQHDKVSRSASKQETAQLVVLQKDTGKKSIKNEEFSRFSFKCHLGCENVHMLYIGISEM